MRGSNLAELVRQQAIGVNPPHFSYDSNGIYSPNTPAYATDGTYGEAIAANDDNSLLGRIYRAFDSLHRYSSPLKDALSSAYLKGKDLFGYLGKDAKNEGIGFDPYFKPQKETGSDEGGEDYLTKINSHPQREKKEYGVESLIKASIEHAVKKIKSAYSKAKSALPSAYIYIRDRYEKATEKGLENKGRLMRYFVLGVHAPPAKENSDLMAAENGEQIGARYGGHVLIAYGGAYSPFPDGISPSQFKAFAAQANSNDPQSAAVIKNYVSSDENTMKIEPKRDATDLLLSIKGPPSQLNRKMQIKGL